MTFLINSKCGKLARKGAIAKNILTLPMKLSVPDRHLSSHPGGCVEVIARSLVRVPEATANSVWLPCADASSANYSILPIVVLL